MKNLFAENPSKNTDELKEFYKANQLVYYTPTEEIVNTATHAVGAVAVLIFMCFMIIKSNVAQSYATSLLTCLLIASEFMISSVYHGVKNLRTKLIWRKIDFPAVNLNVIACSIALCLMYGNVYGYVSLAISFAITISMFVLCFYNFSKFRKVSVASCFLIGILMFVQFFIINSSDHGMPDVALYLYICGLILCLIGAVLFGIRKRYAHCVFHVFVLIGPILFVASAYLQIY